MTDEPELIQEGKVKFVYADPKSANHVVIEFTDTVTAGDGDKKEIIEGKGQLACETSWFLLSYLSGKGIKTHLESKIDEKNIRCRRVEILPLEIICRNVAAGSFCRRYGVEKGTILSTPLLELFLKDDSLHYPLIDPRAAIVLGHITKAELDFINSVTLSVNYYLSELLSQVDLALIDFKLEFGKTENGQLLLADEISGDTIRVWTREGDSLDKDLFRESSGSILDAYKVLLTKLNETKPENIETRKEKVRVVVMPKEGIKNPPGETTKNALLRLGFKSAHVVRMGKVYEITINHPLTTETLEHLQTMNQKLLSNPVAEKSKVRLEKWE